MSDIAAIASSAAASYEASPKPVRTVDAGEQTKRGADSVELSDAARQAASSDEVRHDLVNRVRAELEAGTYETEGKLDTAIEGLKEDLRKA